MKNKKNIRVVTITLSIILVLIALLTTTYALFTNETVADNKESYTTGLLSITATSKTENISLASALPITDEEGIKTEPYIFTITNVGNVDYKFDLKLLSTGDSGTNTVISPIFIKLQVDDGEVTTLSSSGGKIKENLILKPGESIDVKIRVWLSIDTTNDQINRKFTSQIVADGQAVYTEENTSSSLSSYIKNIYNVNDTAINNGITYNLDTQNMLMQDTEGNIRYYGLDTTNTEDKINIPNSLNNYIYFNCDIYPDTNCELWRVVGVFEDKVKLISNKPLGNYSFNTNTSWNDSEINKLLNDTYLNNKDKTGIKENTKSLIEDNTYNMNTINDISSIYTNELYELESSVEIVNQNKWTGKIALPYLSDYSYATDLKQCNKAVEEYSDINCVNSSWMASMFMNNESNNLMLLYQGEEIEKNLISITKTGKIINSKEIDNFNVFPVLYLNKDVMVSRESTGSITNPYRILIQ